MIASLRLQQQIRLVEMAKDLIIQAATFLDDETVETEEERDSESDWSQARDMLIRADTILSSGEVDPVETRAISNIVAFLKAAIECT